MNDYFNTEHYEQIEKYCLNLMDEKEKHYFENEMLNNAALYKAVQEYQILLDTFNHQQNEQFIHQALSEVHSESQSHLKVILNHVKLHVNKYWRTASVAASVAFIASIITFAIARNIYKKDNRAQYQTLRNEINSIKKDQREIKSEVADVKKIKTPQPDGAAKFSGTCFAISQHGYVVTNLHVIEGSGKVFLYTPDNIAHETQIISTDTENDLAILKVNEEGFSFPNKIPYSLKKYTPNIAQRVYSLGYPKSDIVYNEGYISSITGFEGDSTRYQLELPSGPGVSGAPIIDEFGNIIGVISGKQSHSEGITYAVKTKSLLNMMKKLPNDFTSNELASNLLSSENRNSQVKKIQPFVYVIKVYNN